MIEVQCLDRWQAYYRFQSLELDCRCRAHRPLEVDVQTPGQLVQVWSVLQTVSGDRSELCDRLERCWQLRAEKCNHSGWSR